MVLLVLFSNIGQAQAGDCNNKVSISYYAKAQKFKTTNLDSFQKYSLKLIATNNQLCEDEYMNRKIELWKKEALIDLAKIEMQEENHLKSNEYLNSINDTLLFKNPNPHLLEKELAELLSSNHYKLGNNILAAKYLLPFSMLEYKITTDKPLIEFCAHLLLKEYDQEYLINELNKSIFEFYEKKGKYYIKFLDVEILFIRSFNYKNVNPRDFLIPYLKTKILYKMLHEDKPDK